MPGSLIERVAQAFSLRDISTSPAPGADLAARTADFAASSSPVGSSAVSKALNNDWTSGSTTGAQTLWRLWRDVGEIRYSTNEQAKLLQRVLWDITINGMKLTTEESALLLKSLCGNVKTQAMQAGLHLQVTGAYTFCRLKESQGGKWIVVPRPASAFSRKIEDEASEKITLGIRDPYYMDKYCSTVDAAKSVAEEILLVRLQSRSTTRSRIAQTNTLLYPVEAVNDPAQFEADLVDTMTAPMTDERSMQVAVPNIVRSSGEWIDKWKTLDLTGPIDEKLTNKIERLIRQLAVQLDCPPELLLGMGELNHWSAWAVQEDNWTTHLLPLADSFAEALEHAIRSMFELDGAVLTDVTVMPNPANILKRRPTVPDVLAAFNSGLVSGRWARLQIGATEDDAPTPDEIELRLGRKNVKDPEQQAEPDQKGADKREQQRGSDRTA